MDADYFPEGPGGWAIDERWNGSAILADTGNGIHGEGLCHFHHPDGFLIPMDAAVHGAPDFMVGPMYRTLGGTGFYNKEFDNLYPLGHHMHPWKPEAYNFNAWRNKRYKNDCHTSIGLLSTSPRRCWPMPSAISSPARTTTSAATPAISWSAWAPASSPPPASSTDRPP